MTKILFITANPFHDINIDSDEEYREISAVLKEAKNEVRFQLAREDAVEFGDLSRLIAVHKPQIVHFSVPSLPATGLYFYEVRQPGRYVRLQEAINGQVKTRATFPRLAQFFQTFVEGVFCVVLTTPVGQAEILPLVATVDYVIGMTDWISNKQGVEFSRGFYEGLGRGFQIPAAFEAGVFKFEMAPGLSGYTSRPFIEIAAGRALRDVGHVDTESASSGTSPDALRRLRIFLDKSFSLEEIRTIANDLGIDYEAFPDRGKPALIRELLSSLERKNRVQELLDLPEVKNAREKSTWYPGHE